MVAGALQDFTQGDQTILPGRAGKAVTATSSRWCGRLVRPAKSTAAGGDSPAGTRRAGWPDVPTAEPEAGVFTCASAFRGAFGGFFGRARPCDGLLVTSGIAADICRRGGEPGRLAATLAGRPASRCAPARTAEFAAAIEDEGRAKGSPAMR